MKSELMTIDYLNNWFSGLNHREKVIVEGGYIQGSKLTKDQFNEIDDTDDSLLLSWNSKNEFTKLECYCHYLNVDINVINIDECEKFYFMSYDDKVSYLNLDNRMKWDNDSLNLRYKMQ